MEPLELFLDHLQGSWAARSVKSGDENVKRFLMADPSPGYHQWHDGSTPAPTLDSPICRAFHISDIPAREDPAEPLRDLSYGDATDSRTSSVQDLTIFEASQEESKKSSFWAPRLDALRDRGWRIAYTDGSGAEGVHAAGVHSEGTCGSTPKSYGKYAGHTASVADAELLGICLALETEHQGRPLVIASDSQAALKTRFNLARGEPPRSGIETRIKDRLEGREVGALWVRSHIGIPGDEKEDRRTALTGTLGTVKGEPDIVTYEGLRAKGKAQRAISRTGPGFGKRRTEWGKHALSAYTWTRTNKGPQRAWLHTIGKADDPTCPCGHPTQDGNHLVFHCAHLATSRRKLLPPGIASWEGLDDPHYVTEGGREEGRKQEKVEGGEAFFQDLYWELKEGGRRDADEAGDA